MYSRLLGCRKQALANAMNTGIQTSITPAVKDDLDSLKSLADENKHELGFVLKPALEQGIAEGRIFVSRLSNSSEICGFVHFRHRRDRVTKIYHLCVQARHRHLGIGWRLLDELRMSANRLRQTCILLKCPEGLQANLFYQKCRFTQVETTEGKRRRLLTWELPLPG